MKPLVVRTTIELRLNSGDGQFRAFYFTTGTEGILVIHACVKKTPQTPPAEIQLGRKRLKEMQDDQD